MCAYFIFCTPSPKYLTQKKYPHPPFYKAKKKRIAYAKKNSLETRKKKGIESKKKVVLKNLKKSCSCVGYMYIQPPSPVQKTAPVMRFAYLHPKNLIHANCLLIKDLKIEFASFHLFTR
jgi:hypothetical protein